MPDRQKPNRIVNQCAIRVELDEETKLYVAEFLPVLVCGETEALAVERLKKVVAALSELFVAGVWSKELPGAQG